MATKEKEKKKKIGKIVGIHGAVVDIHFPGDLLELHNAMHVKDGERNLILEVFEHLPDHTVRSLAMGASTGLKVGLEVEDTGDVLHVPVGPEMLGRIVNIFGDPVDNAGPVVTEVKQPIYRLAPDFIFVERLS